MNGNSLNGRTYVARIYARTKIEFNATNYVVDSHRGHHWKWKGKCIMFKFQMPKGEFFFLMRFIRLHLMAARRNDDTVYSLLYTVCTHHPYNVNSFWVQIK